MQRFVALRLLLLLLFVTAAIFTIRTLQSTEPPVPPGLTLENVQEKPLSRMDGCIISEESASVHYKEGERNYEEALIQFVNDNNTVQVWTFDTKLTLLFEIKPERLVCFREGSIVPVTITKCKKNREDECDFSLPHTVYVRTEQVRILNWKYFKSASR